MPRRPLRPPCPVLMLVLAAAACALPVALVSCTSSSTAAGGTAPESGEIPAARLKELEAWWRLYLKNDPKWPEKREQWLAGPAEERTLLLDNLYIELLSDDAVSRGGGTSFRSARARKEITWFGTEAATLLDEGMKALVARDHLDLVALDRVGLALVELRATKQLAQLAATPESEAAGEGGLQLRLAAVRALAQLDDPEATAALVDRLAHDAAWQVRGNAAQALRRRNADPQARASLLAALSDGDGFVRAQAVQGLVVGLRTDDTGAIERVVSFLEEDPAPVARAAAAEALALFAFDPTVKAALVAALKDRDLQVARKAAHALLNVREKPVQLALIDTLERVKGKDEGFVSELLVILEANVGSRPRDINPAGWRALVQQEC